MIILYSSTYSWRIGPISRQSWLSIESIISTIGTVIMFQGGWMSTTTKQVLLLILSTLSSIPICPISLLCSRLCRCSTCSKTSPSSSTTTSHPPSPTQSSTPRTQHNTTNFTPNLSTSPIPPRFTCGCIVGQDSVVWGSAW